MPYFISKDVELFKEEWSPNDLFIVLVRRQSSLRARAPFCIATAEWNGLGWQNCSDSGQPLVVQWFDPDRCEFVNCTERNPVAV